MNVHPVTNEPISPDAIQRVLHIASKVLIYAIPPILSSNGFAAASWTSDPRAHIFTARMRVIEVALQSIGTSNTSAPASQSPETSPSGSQDELSVTILLEDPTTGELFAAAPYTHTSVVEQAKDSSRFFAVRVVGEGGRKRATLGLGFEERPDAFDFGVALQDARRMLGWESYTMGQGTRNSSGQSGGINHRSSGLESSTDVRDLKLKEGEMITINIGSKNRRIGPKSMTDHQHFDNAADIFAILPPPSSKSKEASGDPEAFPILPPPPPAPSLSFFSATEPSTTTDSSEPSAEDLGFDDGEFGEFQ